MYGQEERAEVRGETGPEEGDEAEDPLSRGEDDGQEAAPGVETVGVGDGRGGQTVTVPGSLAVSGWSQHSGFMMNGFLQKYYQTWNI